MARITNFTFIWLKFKQPQVASGYHARPGRSEVTGGPDNLQDCTFVNLPGILTDTRLQKTGDTVSPSKEGEASKGRWICKTTLKDDSANSM